MVITCMKFHWNPLTQSPLNKLLSAKFLICFNFQSASVLLKVGELLSECQTAWIWARRRVTQHLIESKLFTYRNIVVSSGLRVKSLGICATNLLQTDQQTSWMTNHQADSSIPQKKYRGYRNISWPENKQGHVITIYLWLMVSWYLWLYST